MPMPPDIFQQYLEMLSAPHGAMVLLNPELLKLEQQRADILWDLLPKYYTNKDA
jgi:hypothetical protein